MNVEPPSPKDREATRRWLIWSGGILAAETSIAVLYAASVLLTKKLAGAGGGAGLLGVPSMFLVPVVGGLIASYVWRSLRPTLGATFLNALWITFFAWIIATLAFHEGIICILILTPLFYSAILAGALVGRIIFRGNRSRLHLSLLPVLALAVPAELLTRADKESIVADQIIIHAPASKVWPQLTSFPQIPAVPRFWLFRLGLPYPVATTSAGDFVSANRECIFSHGAIFKERVIELLPLQRLTFEIIESPQDPELVGHLTPRRGQFVLRENGDGTTTLTGSTWYTLQVRPGWYFDLWTRHIFRSVHLRVMEDIRRRSES